MEEQEKNLKKLFQQAKELNSSELLTGLVIIMKDTAEFLTARGYNDEAAIRFRKVYYATLNEDRFYWECFGRELFCTLADAGMPDGIVDNAANGLFDLSPIVQANNIYHEWARYSGWCFFKKITAAHGTAVIGDDGLEEAQNQFCSETEASVVEVAQRLLDNVFNANWYWFPSAVLLAMMLLRTRFNTVPDPNETKKEGCLCAVV